MARKKKTKKASRSTRSAAEPAAVKIPPQVVPHPTAGRKITEFEAALDAKLKEAEDGPAKRGPGRPRIPREPEPPQFEIDVVKSAVCVPFDLWAARVQVKELKLTPQEAESLAKPAKELLDYYLPQIPVIAWAWISLSITSYNILKGRLELIAEIKKARSAQAGTEARGRSTPQEQGGSPSPPVVRMPTLAEIKPEVIE